MQVIVISLHQLSVAHHPLFDVTFNKFLRYHLAEKKKTWLNGTKFDSDGPWKEELQIYINEVDPPLGTGTKGQNGVNL